MRKIEICCGSVEDVIAARYGGACRVELCSATELGGLTPSAGLIAGAIREKGPMQVNVLIRPRAGGFVYTRAETDVMEADIAAARMAGADGVVIGALTPGGDIDMSVMRRLMDAASGMNATFHRAFDECRNPFEAIGQLSALGINRLLTSGQKPTAPEGAELIRQLVQRAGHGLTVMPGSGINPSNIDKLEAATGAVEFHSTATDKSAARPRSDLFGLMPAATSAELVKALTGIA